MRELGKNGVVVGEFFDPQNREAYADALVGQTPEFLNELETVMNKEKQSPETNFVPEVVTANKENKSEEWSVPESVIDYLGIVGELADEPKKKKIRALISSIRKEKTKEDVMYWVAPCSFLTLEDIAEIRLLLGISEDKKNLSGEQNLEKIKVEAELKENFEKAKAEYVRVLTEYRIELQDRKQRFAQPMMELGVPHRQLPSISLPDEVVNAKNNFDHAERELRMSVLAHGDRGALDNLASMEDTVISLQRSVEEAYSDVEKLIQGKAEKVWNKAPLSDRFAVGGSLLDFFVQMNGGDPNSVRFAVSRLGKPSGRPIDGIKSRETPVVPISKDEIQDVELIKEKSVEKEISEEIPDVKKIEPTELISGNFPFPKKFQFDQAYKDERKKYNIAFETRILDLLLNNTINNILRINHEDGQIMVLQMGNTLTVLLNGQKIGSGEVKKSGLSIQYDRSIGDDGNFKNAFEKVEQKLKEERTAREFKFVQ